MQIVDNIDELQSKLSLQQSSIGFVPTMGALHKGHLSLVKESVANNGCNVVSIYVNPTQFNDKKDLKKYPRNLEQDFNLLKNTGVDIVFTPKDSEMYPKPDNRQFDFGNLDKIMEGKHRPGHFNGVGQIVLKLFDIVKPQKAYFGLKDFQQLAIINKLVKDYQLDIEVVPCPIIREQDGLAMSSRNVLLEENKRKAAPFIFKTLQKAVEMSGHTKPDGIISTVKADFEKNKELSLEYFEIVDNENLQPVKIFSRELPCTACIAVVAGKVRLIDNVQFYL